MNLDVAAKGYVKAKIAWTKCKQKHFVLTCNRCIEARKGCGIYTRYYEAWKTLQEAVEKLK